MPNANRTKVSAQITTAPATTAAHQMPASGGSRGSAPGSTITVSIMAVSPSLRHIFILTTATMCWGTLVPTNRGSEKCEHDQRKHPRFKLWRTLFARAAALGIFSGTFFEITGYIAARP
jgi:hypothetical protein